MTPTTSARREIPHSDLRPGMRVIDPVSNVPQFVADILRSDAYVQPLTLDGRALPYRRTFTVEDEPIEPVLRAIPTSSLTTSVFTGNFAGGTTIGSDPEIFVVGEDGKIIPAFAFLPKKGGERISFYDGFQGEWITVPNNCLGLLTDNVRLGMQEVWDLARKFDPKAKLTHASVADITHCDRKKIDPQHYQLGCAPSMNAYGEEPMKVQSPELLPFRSAGWHMHFSFSSRTTIPFDKVSAVRAAKMMDRVLGVALVSFGDGYTDPQRRLFYGRAGEFRLGKTFEYRVPDVILGAHPATFNLLWDLGRAAMWLGVKGFDFLFDGNDDEVREAINKYDVTLARTILARNENLIRRMLMSVYYSDAVAEHGFKTLMEGIGTVVEDPTNIAGNWKLDQKWNNEYQGHDRDVTWMNACQYHFFKGGKV